MIGAEFDSILLAAQRGEPWAMEALYRDLAPVVLGYLRAHGASEPEDLVSEVFVAAIRGINRFRGGEQAFRSWLFTIVHRRLQDERRRRGRRREDSVHAGELEMAGGLEPGADVGALEAVATERMQALLARLTDDQRAVVLLRVIADLSVDETARIVGKRPGAVKTMQRRALAQMRKQLRKSGEHVGATVTMPFPGRAAERSPE